MRSAVKGERAHPMEGGGQSQMMRVGKKLTLITVDLTSEKISNKREARGEC